MVIVYNMSQHIEIIYKKAQQKRETEENSGKRKNERLKLKERKEAGLRLTCVDVLLLEPKSRHSPKVTDATKITSVVTIHTSRLSRTLPIKQYSVRPLLSCYRSRSILQFWVVLFNTNPRSLAGTWWILLWGERFSCGILQGVCWCSWRERRANLLPPPSTQKTPNLLPSTNDTSYLRLHTAESK